MSLYNLAVETIKSLCKITDLKGILPTSIINDIKDCCGYTNYNLISSIRNNHMVCFLKCLDGGTHSTFYNELITGYVAEYGSLEMLSYIYEKNYVVWSTNIISLIAKNGNVECLEYARENGCPWNSAVPMYAAEFGNLECLKYAYEHGCPWDELTPAFAAEFGNLACLEYAYKHGCPWNEMTPMKAVMEGHLKCLIYAFENECPCDERTLLYAKYFGHKDCLIYAYNHGCPNVSDDYELSNPYEYYASLSRIIVKE